MLIVTIKSIILSFIVLSVTIKPIMLNVVTLNAVIVSVVMQNAIILSVVAPPLARFPDPLLNYPFLSSQRCLHSNG
jgi:hypothetical protein